MVGYIGRSPQIGGYHKLDSITCDGSTAYTMQLDSANFTPESVNHLIVSVNGVIQAPTDSFTVSGSTITFASSLSVSDTIDFIMALGNVLDIGTPSDGTISASKLATTSITGQTAETSANDSDSLLIYDDSATALRKMTRANFLSGVGGTNTPAFRVTRPSNQTLTDAANNKAQFDSEDFDTDNCYDSTTNYRFTPTTAGKYLISTSCRFLSDANDRLATIDIMFYKNGSSFSNFPNNYRHGQHNGVTVQKSDIITFNGTTDYLEIYVNADVDSGGIVLCGGQSSILWGYRLIGV